jgi:hypothetical protein
LAFSSLLISPCKIENPVKYPSTKVATIRGCAQNKCRFGKKEFPANNLEKKTDTVSYDFLSWSEERVVIRLPSQHLVLIFSAFKNPLKSFLFC